MRTSHAELFTTYTAAKGIAPAAELMTASATDQQRTAAVDDVKLQQAIEVKRQLYKNHYATANSAVLEKHCEDEDIQFVSSHAPMAIVTVTARELKALALDTSVERIDLFENHEVIMPVENDTEPDTEAPPYIEEHWNLNSRAEFTRDALGLTGTGVKIGQVELGLPYVDDQLLADATIITNSTYGGEEWESIANENHATRVAQVMVGMHGIAPSAVLYSACADNELRFCNAIEWLISAGVNVINMSATIGSANIYNSFCEYVDCLAFQHDIHFVTTAGNVDELSIPDVNYYMIGSPARAYNAIVVGAYNDQDSVPANDSEIADKQSDDVLENYSLFEESLASGQAYIGANKPNLVATGNYFWNDRDHKGTSYAAPQVTGVIAQLCGYAPVLKTKQSTMGAILMASCGRKLMDEVQDGTEINSVYSFKGGDFLEECSVSGSNNQISNKQGAGKLDAYWAYTIVRDNLYWTLTPDSYEVEKTKSVYISKDSDTLVRIAAFWLMKRDPSTINNNQTIYLPQAGLEWDLHIVDPNNEMIFSSTVEYNNYEIIQFEPEISGTYTIIIGRNPSPDNPASYVGLAVWQD